ncbi:MAG: MipA/OmpV family protein [Sulfuricaulis sp.]|uniref:MipA/OmpV family protein n=1 Tax=Sulfuricaulis sp. TaxID=2003553 RepID=UPI0025EA45CB|nr:MipA/OmpV family protein [Sulfuricaulis sp.]MCR4346419.1 MipA/OmpV family protein [Sulfuricaulis sp.]
MTFAFGLTVPLAALAELSNDPLLGPGLRTRPAYDGSAAQHIELVPVVRYFGQPWFVRSTQGVLEGGVRVAIAPGLHAGAQLAYEPGRKTSESGFLKDHNVSDINPGASIGLQVEWDHNFDPMPITLLARTRQHTDSDLGAQMDLRLSAGVYRGGRVTAGVFTQATWANAKSAGSFYGISPQQSAATGLPAFNAGSGLLFASFGLLWSVDLNQDWVMVGSMESRRLHSDAARSPLVERGSNYYVSAGLAYCF